MGKKVKFKVKRGKVKVKLKSKDEALPLSGAEIRGLLALGMASALESDTDWEPKNVAAGAVRPAMLAPGDSVRDPVGSED